VSLVTRSLAVLVLATGLYHAALPLLPVAHPHGREAGLAMEAKHRDRAERYLARATPPDVVLVGSSIAGRLGRSLPESWQLLAFDGGTPLTGLEIVRRHPPKPKVVLVEVNRPLAPLDRDLVEPLFDPWRRRLTGWLPGLAQANRPSQRALVAVRALRDRALGRGDSEPERIAVPESRPDLRDRLVALTLARQSEAPSRPELRRSFEALGEAVDALLADGVEVFLVAIPEHPGAAATPRQRAILARARLRFPETRYRWVPPADPERFETTDGEHLGWESAARYTAGLGRWLDEARVLATR